MADSKKQTKKHKRIASVTIKIGTNEDGSARIHFKKDEPIELTLKEINKYKKYLKCQQ